MLASVQKILGSYKHPNADNLWIVTVLGYDVIINPCTMPSGDLVGRKGIFITIDSVIPDTFSQCPFYPYLKQSYMGRRVSSIKIRGCISQGLFLNFTDIPVAVDPDLNEGTDLTCALGITKYYAPDDPENPKFVMTSFQRNSLLPYDESKPCPPGCKPFPKLFPKTDQARLQNNPCFLELIKNRSVVVTIKMDGQSSTWFCTGPDGDVGVCSRNYRLVDCPETRSYNPQFYDIDHRYKILEKLKVYGRSLAVQGEIYGERINGNRHHIKGTDFVVFDVYTWDTLTGYGSYLPHNEVQQICKDLDLPCVKSISLDTIPSDIAGWLSVAREQVYTGGHMAEGIVVKTGDKIRPYISFKVVSPEYLVRYGL